MILNAVEALFVYTYTMHYFKLKLFPINSPALIKSVFPLQVCAQKYMCNLLLYDVCIGSTTSTRRLCNLSSAGKFGRGKAEAKLSQGG